MFALGLHVFAGLGAVWIDPCELIDWLAERWCVGPHDQYELIDWLSLSDGALVLAVYVGPSILGGANKILLNCLHDLLLWSEGEVFCDNHSTHSRGEIIV